MTTSEGKLLAVPDLQKKLGVSDKQVRQLFRDEVDPIPSFKVGREYRVHPEDFEEWLARQRKKGVA